MIIYILYTWYNKYLVQSTSSNMSTSIQVNIGKRTLCIFNHIISIYSQCVMAQINTNYLPAMSILLSLRLRLSMLDMLSSFGSTEFGSYSAALIEHPTSGLFLSAPAIQLFLHIISFTEKIIVPSNYMLQHTLSVIKSRYIAIK